MQYYFLFFLALPFLLHSAPLKISVTAETAILINADTGAILYQKKPHQKMYPASITKIATALFALKLSNNSLDESIVTEQDCIGSVAEEAKQRANYKLPSYWLVKDCSHMGIKKGEELTLKDLMYGMMVASADDASNIIAYRFGEGNIPLFMEQLNDYLKELGCNDTYFNNPHGLHHPEHVTTAYEMAKITSVALKNPLFKEIVATVRYTRPKTNKQEATTLIQTNRLLRTGELFYPKAIGVKTGYTSKAGSTLVAAAAEGDRTLIAVLMNAKERKNIFREAKLLFDAAFNQPRMEKTLAVAGNQKYQVSLPGAAKPIRTYLAADLTLTYYPAEEPEIKAFIQWEPLQLPIEKDQKVGELRIVAENGNILKTGALYALEASRPTLAHRMSYLFNGGILFWILAGLTGCFLAMRFFRRA